VHRDQGCVLGVDADDRDVLVTAPRFVDQALHQCGADAAALRGLESPGLSRASTVFLQRLLPTRGWPGRRRP